MLLLYANSVVSTDRLTDGLWEDDPPETAQKALQVHVSALRKVLGRERVVTREPGYLLRVEPEELDLTRFEHLREQGKPADALALWRGPPLSEFELRRFAQADIARLQDARLACLEERFEHDLRAGRHAEVTGELEGLVQEYLCSPSPVRRGPDFSDWLRMDAVASTLGRTYASELARHFRFP